MSRRLTEIFESEIEIAEESWEETIVGSTRKQPTNDDVDVRETERLYESEPLKTYRLVYNPQAESMRLDESEAENCNPALHSITELITSSKRILSLGDNWDEEGSIGYNEATWIRATDFVRNLAISYWNRNPNHSLPLPPRILPGPEGSIDIHWKARRRELLINVPASEASLAGYYGSSDSEESIKGKLDTSKDNLWILTWLLQ